MPALSFHHGWLDQLLLSEKQQTTRPQNTRFHVGDTAHIYIEQRRRIIDKPLRRLTYAGIDMVYARHYPFIPDFHKAIYHAHFLGIVVLTEVFDIHPTEMSLPEFKAWVLADGFTDTLAAGDWFVEQYDEDWQERWWTVVRWDGWQEQYFQPGEVIV
ncbi:MAG: hypothetical protein BA864_06900 [Desulfuromonadales bacterium C00003093]|nr:MAG: hypothetical protein BA864_06900 [Desulfuromonadales bacterium C00003093]